MKIFTLNIKKYHADVRIYYIFAFAMVKKGNVYNWMFWIGVFCLLTTFPVKGVGQTLPYKSHVPDSILRHIFHAATLYATEVKEYKADLYLKGQLQIHKQNRIIKYIPSMFRFEKGVNKYIHESLSELHYTAPNIYDRKVRAMATTFPGGESRFFEAYIIIICLILSTTGEKASSINYALFHATEVHNCWKVPAGYLPMIGQSVTWISKGNMI